MSERIHVTTCPLFDDTADVVTQTCTVRFALDLAHVVALREGEGRDAGRTVAFLAGGEDVMVLDTPFDTLLPLWQAYRREADALTRIRN